MAIWGSYRIRLQPAGSRSGNGDAARNGSVSDIWNRHVAESDGNGLPRAEDIAVLAAMGYRAFQFELLWPAVLRTDGTPNEEGIRRCLGLIGTIRQYGMTPIIAACRWQRPLWMRAGGKWVNVKSSSRYQTYMSLLYGRFGGDAVIRTRSSEPWDAAARELMWLRALDRNPAEAMAGRYRIEAAEGSLA